MTTATQAAEEIKHDLILHEEYYTREGAAASDDELPHIHICNACIDPIVLTNSRPPFYTSTTTPSSLSQCTTIPNPFYLHQSCDNLPSKLQHPLHHYKLGNENCKDAPLVLLPTSSSSMLPFSMFRCEYGCDKYCNGFVYSCEKCGLQLDVMCALLPDAITYELHGKSHILFLSHDNGYLICNCCGYICFTLLFYRCSSCPNFTIDARCVLLPSSVSHKYDRHALELTPYDESSTPKDDDVDFCEICEVGMRNNDSESWFYHCEECITSFHIDCIPCAGGLSKMKFGGSIRVRCHDCLLICIRLLNSYSYTCGRCEATIQGRINSEDDDEGIAFECNKCGYWLDYECAEAEWIRD